MAGRLSIAIVLLAVLLGYVYNAYVQRFIRVAGVFREPGSTELAPGEFVVVNGTINCEDLHLHEPSGLLFTACEDDVASRRKWFPPIEHFFNPSTERMKGKLEVIDPKTFEAKVLELEGFSGPFVTHGIDVIDDPEKPQGEAVYIFAVNHKPNPEHYGENGDANAPKSHSVVELFHHVIGSKTARHIRTIWHPLMVTPNDIVAESPTSFFVTNDHFYTEGLLRAIEDVVPAAKWTNVVHIRLENLGLAPDGGGGDSAGVHASIALEKLHNLNGLGHGRGGQDEILVTGCVDGLLHVGEIRGKKESDEKVIRVKEVVEFDSPIDNPSYFRDPYANGTFDASGFVSTGPTRGIDFFENKGKESVLDPVMVWKATPRSGKKERDGRGEQDGTVAGSGKNWDVSLLFQDDGRRLRTSSASVLVAIDPKEEGGRRRAWLFVTGYQASNVIAVKVDL
ncbi:hypothetical protein BBK36DRAFT_1184939 [Trichoderma citrinoviride]|uniref:Serum paraoxonase/arylesterase family protein n=1 Tax=Trichoderma citrinoviride TaxID=58853 RepID=A0A2T4AZ28_9HYPO|nr:hypothetical protein BBK36DRAFT_1184939 [Trichoderma citrinoviride]PTB62323.1 hypothetical protein BBK36DRAFT_1184939 [Trichoderma citrinoviride]